MYSAESDALWPLVLAKLEDQALDSAIDSELNAARKSNREGSEADATPERLVKKSREHVLFSDKIFWLADPCSLQAVSPR